MTIEISGKARPVAAPKSRDERFSLDAKYLQESGTIYLTGIQALVRVLLDQQRSDARRGLRTAGFVSGYPGSPVGSLDIELGRVRGMLDTHHIVHRPGLNEDLAATAVFGSQLANSIPGAKYDGVFGMWFGKAPGVDRTGDAFRHNNFRGVWRHGGVLAVAGDDPAAKSSVLPSDSNVAFYDFNMPMLSPGDVQDLLDLGLHGYALSRASGLWTGLKLVANVADGAGTASVGPDRIVPIVPLIEFDGAPFEPRLRINEAGRQMLPVERDLLARLMIARQYARQNRLNRIVVDSPSAWLGILSSGKSYYDLRQALEDLGLDEASLDRVGIRILKMGMVFPVDPETIREFARGLEEIIVVEDKRAFLELFVKDILYGTAGAPRIVGKRDELDADLLPSAGELNPDILARVLAARIRRKHPIESIDARLRYLDRNTGKVAALPAVRLSYFCSGCPHNRSLAVPEGSVVGAGIGCHIMAIFMGHEGFGTLLGFTQMGGEGAQWVGLAPFSEQKHFYQNLGDGTFAHSGSLALRAAVAAKTNVTYKLLYNSAVAMTGGQAVTGGMSVANLTRLLQAEGVNRIIVSTEDPARYSGSTLSSNSSVVHRDRLVEAEHELAHTPGVTVLIHDQQCAAEKRRLRKRRKLTEPTTSVVINERVCEGCGDCGKKSNCLSVQPVGTEFGRKTQIHQSSCNKDYSCLLGDCPSFVTVSSARPKTSPRREPRMPEMPLPVPPPIVPTDDFAVHMTGIGGTGVVTVNQILGTAAVIDGKTVRAMDQTGSSQKAGPVVSHLRVFDGNRDIAAAVPTGGADVMLIFDLLVGGDPVHLAKADMARTVAVVSTAQVPTGKMVADPKAAYPKLSELRARIEGATRADEAVFIDSQAIAEALFGDHMASNMILVGAAWQRGALPISIAAIEQAIRLNGVGIDLNIAAFHWGRVAVAAPDRLETLDGSTRNAAPQTSLAPTVAKMLEGIDASGELKRLLAIRIGELIAYQDEAYAGRYMDFVAHVIDAERRQAPGREDLSTAVAQNLFKLMAYKDEYEVARLLLDTTERAKLTGKFGPDAKVAWHLHPAFLRRWGVKNKVRLGPWFAPVLRVLRGLKWLRGGKWDLFGRDHIRRIERALIRHYRLSIEAACAKLDSRTYDLAVEIARLPDTVRGYDHVKLASIGPYLDQAVALARRIGVAVDIDPELKALTTMKDGATEQRAAA